MSVVPGEGIKQRLTTLLAQNKELKHLDEKKWTKDATSLIEEKVKEIKDCLHGAPPPLEYQGQPWFSAIRKQLESWSPQENMITMDVAIQRLAGMDQLVFSNPLSSRIAASRGISAWADGRYSTCQSFLLAAELISLCVTHGRPKVVAFLLEGSQSEQAKSVRAQLLRCMSLDQAVQATELRRHSHNACQFVAMIEILMEANDVEEEGWMLHPILHNDSGLFRLKNAAMAVIKTKPEEALRLYREASRLLDAANTEILQTQSHQSHSKRNGALDLIALESCKIWSNIAYLELLLDRPDPSLTAALQACASNKLSWKAQFRCGQALMH